MDRISTLKEYLKENPTDSFLQHALALEHVKKGDDGAARSLFEDILARDPGYLGSYYHLAKLLERTGNTAEATDWYEKGVRLAAAAGDSHSLNELRSALDDLAER